MAKRLLILFLGVLFFQLNGQDAITRADQLTREEMQSVMEFLSHDLLTGRAPGTDGGYLAELYLQSLFKFLGIKPENGRPYLQPFTMVGINMTDLIAEVKPVKWEYLNDIVGNYTGKDEVFDLEKEAVFVGFGIRTPLWSWDDYKDFDVRDKCVIVRVNDPGFYLGRIFEGRTLTYFGRWKYKIEEAISRGAAAILLIHTDESAGYGWEVVKNSWGGEELYLPTDIQNQLKFRGWIKESSLQKALSAKGIQLEKLYQKSLKRNFKPVRLGFPIRFSGLCKNRELKVHNVVGEITGKSPERIVLSAHLDHLGMNPRLEGDSVFNGAIDNASAVAAMMMTAKILKEYEKDLHYTVTFLACNAEEAGLLGSKYYVDNTDRNQIITNINFESTPVWEGSVDFMGIGANFSTLEDILKILCQQEGLKYSYFSMANQGFFYRSDQYSFARYRIPSLWISTGENDLSGEKKYIRFWQNNYHTVKDEYDPQWKLDGLKQTIKMAIRLIYQLNETKERPKWKNNITFPFVN